jgi:hypothetical protein
MVCHPSRGSIGLTAPSIPPDLPELALNRWCDEMGTTLSNEPTYTFTFNRDSTIVAHYEPSGPTVNYHVNDDIPEDGIAAGNDQNDGRSPQRPM